MSRSRLAMSFAAALVAGLVVADPVAAQEAQAIRDADSARVILVVVLGLVALGVALAIVTVWFWRTTRPDHPVLVRLEVLGSRRARRSDPGERRRLLDAVSRRGSDSGESVPASGQPVP